MIRRKSVEIGMDGSLFVLFVKRELKSDAAVVVVVDDIGCCS